MPVTSLEADWSLVRRIQHWLIQGAALGTLAPSWSKFFHFHAVFSKKFDPPLENYGSAGVVSASSHSVIRVATQGSVSECIQTVDLLFT